MIRTFHPIGQGAFYTERFEGFNMVYDCGIQYRDRGLAIADELVRKSFVKGSSIDLLFISHFDYDHISKIETLKNEFKIKTIILPLLHKEEKLFLTGISESLNFGNNITQLINNPSEYFGDNSKVVFVRPSEGESNIDDESINFQDLNTEINSGTKINFEKWLYIPHNFKNSSRHKLFLKLFKKRGLDINEFLNKIEYGISNRKAIREVYNKLKGGINLNSLILYSGPILSLKSKRFSFGYHNNVFYKFNNIYSTKGGCLYTGDTDLRLVKIKNIFRQYWINVGTIQIPHHGALKSFDSDILSDKNYCCPISFGEKNSYGHPSGRVIYEILKKQSAPIFVTEDPNTKYVELINV